MEHNPARTPTNAPLDPESPTTVDGAPSGTVVAAPPVVRAEDDPNRRATPPAGVDLALFARLATGARSADGDAAEWPNAEREAASSSRITVTNALALEAARVRSLEMTTVPPTPPAPHSVAAIEHSLPQGATVKSRIPSADPGPDDPVLEVGWEPHPLAEVRDRMASGDYAGALQLAEALLLDDPSFTDAEEHASACREALTREHTARLGALDRVPVLAVARSELPWLTLDHRAGFVLSLVDGVSSLEMIAEVSGMRRFDALRVLCDLVERRILTLH